MGGPAVTVELTPLEMELAATAGIMRRIEGRKRGRPEPWGEPPDGWGADIEGAGAEMALAKVLGRYWAGAVVEDPRELDGDVGQRVQVRHTPRRNGCLLLHPTDPDDHAFVLVVGAMPTYRIIGWLYARQGKRESYWRTDTGRPAFFVPQGALRAFQPRTVAA